jgi:hypothetical protein
MLSSFVLSQIVIRTLGTSLGASDVPPPNATPTANPVESALPKDALVTRLESADPKTLALKPFRIRTYKKGWGGGCKLLTRIAIARPTQPGSGSQNGNAPVALRMIDNCNRAAGTAPFCDATYCVIPRKLLSVDREIPQPGPGQVRGGRKGKSPPLQKPHG